MKKHLAFLLLLLLGCNSQKITKETVIIKTPIKYPDGKTETFSSQINIIFYDERILYEFPKYFRKSFDGQVVIDSTGYDYVLVKQKDTLGYMFTSLHEKDFKIRNVNTFLKERITEIIHADTVLKHISKCNIINHKDNVNEYRYKYEVPDIDSLYIFTISDKNKFNYSFSPKLDSFYNSKVFKIIFLASLDPGTNNIDRRISLELMQSPLTDNGQTLNFLKKVPK